MAEENKYPCLLDRLMDERPERKEENRLQRTISLRSYRESVLRDLRWLLNASRHLRHEDIYLYPEAAASVLNYGVPNFGGQISDEVDLHEMAREIRRSILLFEPRILPGTLKVIPLGRVDEPGTLSFEIRGQLWALPYAEPMTLRTHLDLDTGEHEIKEIR